MEITLEKDKKIYFVSDVHLGLGPYKSSLDREKLLVKWLNEIQKNAQALFLMGDIFDYWFEYKKVVPRGFVRFLGKIAEFSDQKIPVFFFTGNHDVWVFDYLPSETGITVYRRPESFTLNNQKFYLAHGDGLGTDELSFKLLKKIFTSKILQWLYARIHPNASAAFAHRWSKHSRFAKGASTDFLGEDKEHLFKHSRKILEKEHFDYFVYGHRHIPLVEKMGDKSTIVYLGDWFIHFTYGVFDGHKIELKHYKK